MLRNTRKPVNDYLQKGGISLKEWEYYFQKLNGEYTDENMEDTIATDSIEMSNIVPISMKAIEEAIHTLKNRKAPGVDNIHNEMIKYRGQALIEEIYELFKKICVHVKIPNQWKESITIPIFKKGAKTEPKNYRGICLLSSIQKLL